MTEIVRRQPTAPAPSGGRRRDRPQIAASVLRRRLLSWYREHRRDLPWRGTRDPYAIWVAEVMLQQTTVAVATGYWRRFLAALPTVEALARARRERVLSLWSGLGYYERARNLHRAARRLVAAGRSELPASLEELRELPGVGPYTAAAVASIAFGAAAPVVDGNVRRVLGRLAGIAGDPRRRAAARRIERLAGDILDARSPGDSNQALMELGATVCTPRRPECAHCVWATWCVARALGDPERFPERVPRRPSVSVFRGEVRVVDQRGRWLLRRAPGGSHNAGLWEFPALEWERRSRPGSPLTPLVGAAGGEAGRGLQGTLRSRVARGTAVGGRAAHDHAPPDRRVPRGRRADGSPAPRPRMAMGRSRAGGSGRAHRGNEEVAGAVDALKTKASFVAAPITPRGRRADSPSTPRRPCARGPGTLPRPRL